MRRLRVNCAKVIVFFHSANINRNNIATFAIGKEKTR